MRYLKLTQSTDPKNPADGNPYVYYNEGIGKVWIFMGIKWILETGKWDSSKSWGDTCRWNYYGPPAD